MTQTGTTGPPNSAAAIAAAFSERRKFRQNRIVRVALKNTQSQQLRNDRFLK
jgi:hypothetical protein